MQNDTIQWVAKMEALEKENEKLLQELDQQKRAAREAVEKVRQYDTCIQGLRHTIDVCQEAIFGQAVAISMMMEEEPVER